MNDYVNELLSGIPFFVLVIAAVVVVFLAFRKITKTVFKIVLICVALSVFCPSAWMTVKKCGAFLTGKYAPEKSLTYAIENLDKEAVKKLLEDGEDPNADSYSFFKGNYNDPEVSESLVQKAIRLGKPEIAKLLQQYGAK
ncbi:MAG: hypothetical protein MJ065_03905 [Oscillospiraceae bacterium]|nr:hypothetical protein [Oscillospiraceae bacterium]